MNIRLEMDPADRILLKRKLEKNGAVQRFLTSTVRRMCDPYVPRRTGVLKNTAEELADRITYGQPYARRQYYEHKGIGIRGREWDKRMMASRGKEVVQAVAEFVGGKVR